MNLRELPLYLAWALTAFLMFGSLFACCAGTIWVVFWCANAFGGGR